MSATMTRMMAATGPLSLMSRMHCLLFRALPRGRPPGSADSRSSLTLKGVFATRAHFPSSSARVRRPTEGWNEFRGPLIYLNSAERFPLQLVLPEFRTLYYTDWTLMMAGSFLASLPLILLFLLCQRAFIQGIALTGIKS